MEFWLIATGLFVFVVVLAIAGALIGNLLTLLSRMSDNDHDYIKDWSVDGDK